MCKNGPLINDKVLVSVVVDVLIMFATVMNKANYQYDECSVQSQSQFAV